MSKVHGKLERHDSTRNPSLTVDTERSSHPHLFSRHGSDRPNTSTTPTATRHHPTSPSNAPSPPRHQTHGNMQSAARQPLHNHHQRSTTTRSTNTRFAHDNHLTTRSTTHHSALHNGSRRQHSDTTAAPQSRGCLQRHVTDLGAMRSHTPPTFASICPRVVQRRCRCPVQQCAAQPCTVQHRIQNPVPPAPSPLSM